MSNGLRDQHHNHIFHQQFQHCHILPNKQPVSFSHKTRFTAHLSEAVADLHPLMSRPPFQSQFHAQASCLLRGHFLSKLSMFLFWGFRSHSAVWQCGPLWQAAPYASKRGLTSWQGCGDNTALYSEEQCSHSQLWELTGRAQHCFHMLQLTTWDRNNCTWREMYRGHGIHVAHAYTLNLVCYIRSISASSVSHFDDSLLKCYSALFFCLSWGILFGCEITWKTNRIVYQMFYMKVNGDFYSCGCSVEQLKLQLLKNMTDRPLIGE